MQVNPRSLLITRLATEDLPYLETFDCGDEEMNRFLRTECFQEQELGLNSTTLLFFNGQLAAFVSLCADKLALNDFEEEGLPRKSVPAIKVARLGRDRKFAQYKFGRLLMYEVFSIALDIADNHLGVRYITLDAYPNRVDFYESLGFVDNEPNRKDRRTISMRRDIYSDFELDM